MIGDTGGCSLFIRGCVCVLGGQRGSGAHKAAVIGDSGERLVVVVMVRVLAVGQVAVVEFVAVGESKLGALGSSAYELPHRAPVHSTYALLGP